MSKFFPFTLAVFALVVGAAAQSDEAQRPDEDAVQGGTQPAPTEKADPAPAQEAAPAPAAQPVITSAMIREFQQLHNEIAKARNAIQKTDEIAALVELREVAIQDKDVAALHQISIDIHTKTEALLAAQPGMVEKLARFKELGEAMSRDLPAEKRRKGKRLPKRADEQSPAEPTSAP